jgi:hypothetical protein
LRASSLADALSASERRDTLLKWGKKHLQRHPQDRPRTLFIYLFIYLFICLLIIYNSKMKEE